MHDAFTIALTELRLLMRNRVAAALALAVPVGFGSFLALRTPELGAETASIMWTWIVTTQLVGMLGFTVYITTTISFAARRQDLYLKRLRSGETTDAAILVGLAMPTLLLALVQLFLILGMSRWGGMPWPEHWWPFALALVGGGLMCSSVGVLTSTFTRSAESAQITTAPFFFALLVGTVLVMRRSGDVTALQTAAPGGSLAELTRVAWAPGPVDLEAVATAAVLLLTWIVAPALVAARNFTWAPRA